MTPDRYEHQVWEEIQAWERGGASLATRLGRIAAKPAEIATNILVPRQVQDLVGESLAGLLTHTNNAVHQTIRPERLLERLAREGLLFDSHVALRSHALPLSDQLSYREARRHLLVTTLSGAATGLGGVALLAADVPALFATNLRMVQSMALGYGYDLADPSERLFALHLFRIAAGDPRTRIGLMQELAVVRGALTREALNEIATSSAIGGSLQALRNVARKVGIEIAERKLATMVPIIGAGIGAGFNYLFTQEVAIAARMGYRKRWLMENYPNAFLPEPVASEAPLTGHLIS
ncbi:MAG: hypothetical protein GEEBNDBF_02195 [bacterium]|nr:hypothetical protein [bacterium]